jgi:hypothetical protein
LLRNGVRHPAVQDGTGGEGMPHGRQPEGPLAGTGVQPSQLLSLPARLVVALLVVTGRQPRKLLAATPVIAMSHRLIWDPFAAPADWLQVLVAGRLQSLSSPLLTLCASWSQVNDNTIDLTIKDSDVGKDDIIGTATVVLAKVGAVPAAGCGRCTHAVCVRLGPVLKGRLQTGSRNARRNEHRGWPQVHCSWCVM